eukprot:12156157-Karenia_brevis.AAC.1
MGATGAKKTSTILLQGLRNTKCKISKKTAVIATRTKLRKMHTKHLCKVCLKAKAPRVTRDLAWTIQAGIGEPQALLGRE